MEKRDATQDEDDIELSLQELLQNSPYMCIAVGALSACLTFAVLVSMYIPAEYSDNPAVYANKRKILIERASQTGFRHPPGLATDRRLRNLRTSSYRLLREHEAVVHNRNGIKEYFSSELSPFKLKPNGETDTPYTDILHKFCSCLPEPVLQHKREPSTSSTRSDTDVTMKSLKGVFNPQIYKYLPGKRLTQNYLAQVGNGKRPVEMTPGKHQMLHAARIPHKQKRYQHFKHDNSNLTLTHPALKKSRKRRGTSRPPSERPDEIPHSKYVLSSEGNSARLSPCHRDYEHSLYPDNYSDDVVKRKYLHDNKGDGRRQRKRKHLYSSWNKTTSYSRQSKLPTENGVSNLDENCGLVNDPSTKGTSLEKCDEFCCQTLWPSDDIRLASSSNVSIRIVESEVASNEQSHSRSLSDEDTDQVILTPCYSKQQSNYKSHGLATRHSKQKDILLSRKKLTKRGLNQSVSSPVLKCFFDGDKERVSSTDHKTNNSKRHRKHNCTNKNSSVISEVCLWKTDAVGRSDQLGNSGNALLSSSSGEIDENTWSSVAEPWRQTRKASTKQRITYRQRSAARESQQNVPTFTLRAVRQEDGQTRINPIQENGQPNRERQIKARFRINPSLHTHVVDRRLVSLGNCSSELRSLMRATIMDLQKYESSGLAGNSKSPLFDEDSSMGISAAVAQRFSKLQPRSRNIGAERGRGNSNSHSQDTFVSRDSSFRSKFRKSRQISEDNSEPPLSVEERSLGSGVGIHQLFSRTPPCSLRVGRQRGKDNSNSHQVLTGIRIPPLTDKERLFERRARIEGLVSRTRSHSKRLRSQREVDNSNYHPSTSKFNRNCQVPENSKKQLYKTTERARTVTPAAIQARIHGKQAKCPFGHGGQCPNSSTTCRETVKLKPLKLSKLLPVSGRLRANKSFKMQNCNTQTLTYYVKKHEEALAPGKMNVNKELAINKNKLQLGNISTDKIFHCDQETNRQADRVGISEEGQHCFNGVGMSKQFEVKRSGRQKVTDRREKLYKQTYGGQENNQPTLCNDESVNDDVLGQGCMPYLSDVSLTTNNCAECADLDKQVPFKSSYKSHSNGKYGSDSICVKKERTTHKATAARNISSVNDSLSITHSSEILRDFFTSRKVEDKTRESSSQKQETYTIALSTDTSTLGGVETCSVACDECLNINVHSKVTPLTRSELQTHPCQNDKVKLEIHDQNVSHVSKGEYELEELSQLARKRKHRQDSYLRKRDAHERKHRQDSYLRQRDAHERTTQTGNTGNYKLRIDDAENCNFNDRGTLQETIIHQSESTTGCSSQGKESYHDIFVSKKHRRRKGRTHLFSKKCSPRDTGNEKYSELVFHRSVPDTSSESSRASNSHILDLTSRTNYGAQSSSSSKSGSLSRSLYLAELVTDSSSLALYDNTCRLQDEIDVKTDKSLSRHGYKLPASTSIVKVCSSIESRTERFRYAIKHTCKGNKHSSGTKTSAKLAPSPVGQFYDMPASSIHDVLNVGILQHQPIRRIEYGVNNSWSDTRTAVSNDDSVTGLDEFESSIYIESNTPQSLSVEKTSNIRQNQEPRKNTVIGRRTLKPVCERDNVGMMKSRKYKNRYKRQLSDSCSREHRYGTVQPPDSNAEAAQLPYSCNDEYSYEAIQSLESCTAGHSNEAAVLSDSCTVGHSYETIQSPHISNTKRNCRKMQPLTSSRLGLSSGLKQSLDGWSFEDSSGTVQAADSSSLDNSSDRVQLQDSFNLKRSCESVHSPDSSDSDHCSRTLQSSINSNPEITCETVQTPDSYVPKDSSATAWELASPNPKQTYRPGRTLNRFLSPYWKRSSERHHRQSAHRRERGTTPLSPPSIPLDGERVTYMQIISKNGACKGFRLSELGQRPFPRILKKSHSKSVVIKHDGGDSVLKLARQPVSSSASHLVCAQRSVESRPSVSGSSISCRSKYQHSGRARSRLAWGDNYCEQDVLAQRISYGKVQDLEPGPEVHGDAYGTRDCISSQVCKHVLNKSSLHQGSRDRENPHYDVINKRGKIDFAKPKSKSSKYKKEYTENKFRIDNTASVEPVCKISSPFKTVKNNYQIKQAHRPCSGKISNRPFVCSKITIIDNQRQSKKQAGENIIRQHAIKSLVNCQDGTSMLKNCHKITTNNKRGECATNKSCRLFEIERSSANNERDNLDNVFTKSLHSKYQSTCGVCLPSGVKYRCDCQQTSHHVKRCPKTKHVQTQINSQKPKYSQKRKLKSKAYNGKSCNAENTEIRKHHAPEDDNDEPCNTENIEVGKSSTTEANDDESFTISNNEIKIHRKPVAHKGELCCSEQQQGGQNRKSGVGISNSYYTENNEISIHSEPSAYNSESFSTDISEIKVYSKPQVHEGGSGYAEQRIVGKNRKAAVCNGVCCKTGRARISEKVRKPETINGQLFATKDNQFNVHRKHGTINGQLFATKDNQFNVYRKHGTINGQSYATEYNHFNKYRKNEEHTGESCIIKNKRVGKNRKLEAYNGDLYTTENANISMSRKPNTSKCDSYNTKNTQFIGAQGGCTRRCLADKMRVSSPSYENMRRLGTFVDVKSVGKNKDSDKLTNTLSSIAQTRSNVSAVKKMKTGMVQSQRNLNMLEHRTKFDYRKYANSQLESAKRLKFNRTSKSPVILQLTSRKPEAGLNNRRSENRVQCTDKRRQSHIIPRWEVDELADVIAASPPPCQIYRRDLKQEGHRDRWQEVKQPARSEKQQISTKNKGEGQILRSDASKKLKSSFYTIVKTSPACSLIGPRNAARSRDISTPEGQSAMPIVAPAERSVTVPHGLLRPKVHDNASNTFKRFRHRQSSPNSLMKFSDQRDLNEMRRQGVIGNADEICSRKLPGSNIASQTGMNKHLVRKPLIPNAQMASPSGSHDRSNQLSDVSGIHQVRKLTRPVINRKLLKATPGGDLKTKTSLNESLLTSRFIDFRKNPGYDSLVSRNTMCRAPSNAHNCTLHINKDIQFKGEGCSQESNLKCFCSNKSPSVRDTQRGHLSEIVYKQEKTPLSANSATRQPYRHESIKHVQFGDSNHGARSTTNKPRGSQCGNVSRKQEKEMTNCLRKGRNNCQNCEILQSQPDVIDGDLIPDCSFTHSSGSPRQQEPVGEIISSPQSNNVLNGYVEVPKYKTNNALKNSMKVKERTRANTTERFDRSLYQPTKQQTNQTTDQVNVESEERNGRKYEQDKPDIRNMRKYEQGRPDIRNMRKYEQDKPDIRNMRKYEQDKPDIRNMRKYEQDKPDIRNMRKYEQDKPDIRNMRKYEQDKPDIRNMRQYEQEVPEICSRRQNGQEKRHILSDGCVPVKGKSRQQIHPGNDIPEGRAYTTNKNRFEHRQDRSRLSRERGAGQGNGLSVKLTKTQRSQSLHRRIHGEGHRSTVDQLHFTNVPCNTAPRAGYNMKCESSSAVERPHLTSDEFQAMSLNNSSRNVHALANQFDFNRDFNAEDSSMFPNTTDEVSVSAIFDNISPISDMCRLTV